MKINELIVEQQLDEISAAQIGQGIGRAATATGKAIGATASGAVQTGKNFFQGLKKGWQAGQKAVAGDTDGDGTPNTGTAAPAAGGASTSAAPAASAGVGSAPAPASSAAPTASGGSAPASGTSGGRTASTSATPAAGGGSAPAPASSAASTAGGASSTELNQIKSLVAKLNPEQKKSIAAELEKSATIAPTTTPPTTTPTTTTTPAATSGTSFDTSKLKKDKAAKDAADSAERQKQITATQQANAQSAQADNELVAAVKAEKLKPGFQQDKGLLRRAAAKGIRESKKKKAVVEYHSKFLGMKI